jgi:hypothetical protein
MYDPDFHMLLLVWGGGEGGWRMQTKIPGFPTSQTDRCTCTVLYTFILRMSLLLVNIYIHISIEKLGYVGTVA